MPEYRFDEIAILQNEKRKPVPEDKYTYIGLEHLDSGKLEVTRWGSEVDITGEKLVMHKGDILFGRRNTYLKRAAIAPHDGLFSAHGMIFRPNTDVISERLFPFFIASDYFMDAAIRISVGSLSPTVNWKTLRELKFKLPPLEKQAELADLMQAANDTKVAYEQLLLQMDELVKSQFIEMFGDPITNPQGWEYVKLQTLLDNGWITYHLDGNHGSDYPRSDEFVSSGVPYISANCIIDGEISYANAKYVTEDRSSRFRKGIAQNGDVLFAHNATVGPVAILRTNEAKVILGTSLTAYRCNPQYILPEYLAAYMKCPAFTDQYEREMQQSTRKQVPITTQRKYNFLIPDLGKQLEFVLFVEQSDKSKFSVQIAIYRAVW